MPRSRLLSWLLSLQTLTSLACGGGNLRSAPGRDVGSLRQTAPERGILACDLVDHDHHIVRRYFRSCRDLLVQELEQSQPGLLRAPGNVCQLQQNHVVGIFLSEECRRVEVAIARRDIVDLEEVVRWDTETLDQRTLDRLRYFGKTNLIILAFQHVDLCERHVGLPLKCRARRGRGGFASVDPSPHACSVQRKCFPSRPLLSGYP